jgi:hypothetical protein
MAPRRVVVISTVVVALAGVGAWYGLERAESNGGVKAAAPVPVTVLSLIRNPLQPNGAFVNRHRGPDNPYKFSVNFGIPYAIPQD